MKLALRTLMALSLSIFLAALTEISRSAEPAAGWSTYRGNSQRTGNTDGKPETRRNNRHPHPPNAKPNTVRLYPLLLEMEESHTPVHDCIAPQH